MGGPVSVAAHFLEPRDAIILQPVRERRTDARVVLMVARALEDIGLAVENEAFVEVEADGADAEGVVYLSTSIPANLIEETTL